MNFLNKRFWTRQNWKMYVFVILCCFALLGLFEIGIIIGRKTYNGDLYNASYLCQLFFFACLLISLFAFFAFAIGRAMSLVFQTSAYDITPPAPARWFNFLLLITYAICSISYVLVNRHIFPMLIIFIHGVLTITLWGMFSFFYLPGLYPNKLTSEYE